ncbi:E3 ubiquitin-protein ligase E3D-like [Xenopus laevis]|uniref:E3 ubiquitin-protein ligase E3D n=1 Tax=Xenopus laevis TaxID=8355 RepID=A0A8J1KRY0_XENLA|nr:E3 ubiquitin-protein ligase E3D-like [Xenopus laevis]XP_041418995.1 E3 ubiquitin-protein ligase E3D-like [Xenopus laevis]XP_041418996.1 E3 ubiquitin-protein ligase E3D-like [Xenopus laevis]XP_041418997.1 E3 ubiquitin-protein ligase E3D-like [Xenopus laevis]XP_041418998.1 E3 ubiquitin-protein ligase E3D-like [Xenopus laevis]
MQGNAGRESVIRYYQVLNHRNNDSAIKFMLLHDFKMPKENTKVICRGCKAMLGEKVSSDTIKCYTTEIMIQPSNECYYMISRMKYLESILVRLLMEYSTCRSTFRFCIQMASAFFCWDSDM